MPASACELTGNLTIAARPPSLTTHCVVVPAPHADYRRAIASLENQTEAADAITVIGQPAVTESSGREAPIRWIAPTGKSPFAALNTALSSNSSELVFFLRADEVWTPDHLARMRAVYAQHAESDFVFCDAVVQGGESVKSSPGDEVDLGFSAVGTYLELDYVGGPLSCVSIRRRVLERIVPLVDDTDWEHHPEAVLAVGASLAAARKCRLRRPLAYVTWQSWANASGHNQRLQRDYSYRLKVVRLVGKLTRQLRLDADFVRQLVGMEYDSQPNDWATFARYHDYVQLHQSDRRARRRTLLSMYRRMKHQIRSQWPLTGRLRCWWMKSVSIHSSSSSVWRNLDAINVTERKQRRWTAP